MIHPYNAEQIENITGLRQHYLPKGFEPEYMVWLRMYHKTRSGGGPLPPELLIPLLRRFDLEPASAETLASQKTRWDMVPPGTRVIATIGGYPKKGKFMQIVSAGTLGIQVEGIDRVMELNPVSVKLDTEIPPEINRQSMVDDRGSPDARIKLIEKPMEFVPVKDWRKVETGSLVFVDGKEAQFVGVTPGNQKSLTVELDGGFVEFPIGQVRLIDTVEA